MELGMEHDKTIIYLFYVWFFALIFLLEYTTYTKFHVSMTSLSKVMKSGWIQEYKNIVII